MNLIILEGPDGAGKSTLAASLKELGYTVVPFGVPPREAQHSEQSMFEFFFKPLYHTNHVQAPTVFDRLHLSDRIYAPLMRGGTPMTYRAEALIERYIEAVDGQVIICLPPRRVAFANWLARKGAEYVQDAKVMNKVYDGYVRLLFNAKRNRNFIWYDYTRHQVTSFAHALRQWRGFPLSPGMVGSQRPRFLFVGQQANTAYDLPFMTTENCSGWLFDTLAEAGYREHELAFANAFDINNSMNHFNPPFRAATVIALGQEAEAILQSHKVAFHALPHPQHWKRFHDGECELYVKKLAQLRRNSP